MNFHDLDNFNLADAVKFHTRLNPKIWGPDEHLLPEVREKLLAIAADFQEFLGVDDLKVQDLTVSGSNAAYSYTPHSDIDLHLVVEMPDDPVYQELFNAKKYQYNDEHDIRIDGVPVELYVQPADQKHISQGIYSVKNGDWNQVPQRRRAKIDDSCVQHKAADLDARIHSAIKSDSAEAINRLWDRIKEMRKTSLEKNGEFGCENIAYKLLRNMGCIDKLWKAKAAQRDRELSLEQSKKPRERKKVNYGMRDYWYPGTAYAGQDHPAGTESEQIDEAVADPGVIALQKELKAKGAYLGSTGPAKDGVDGIMGPLTRAAKKKFGGGSGATPVSVDTPTVKKSSAPNTVVVGDSIALGIAQAAKLPHDAVVGRSTRSILSAVARNPAVQGADVAIVSAGTNDYPLANGGRNNNPDATINNISGIRDALKAKQYVWILPFNRNAAQDVLSAIGNDAYVDLAEVSTTRDRLHPTSYSTVANAALSKFAKQGIVESVDPDHLKKILHRFYKSCVSKLKLENPPRLRLETTPDWSRENGSFGQYDPETNTLILATANRHVLDILRTMAHEMTHRQQDERAPLPADAGETGSPYEDQANAMAGRIMRQWAEEQPEMFDGVTLEESAHDHLSVPPVLYHATYRPLLRSIKRGGLGGPGSEKKKWEDSIHGAVYLALDPHVAESYAETSDSVPDEWLDEIVILQISTDGLNPGKFMLDRNVRDNAGDTVEYHGVIPLSNISLLKKNMSEASGYIPTKKQAKDPRFVMALTRDVRPGAVGKEANKLGLETDSQGHPALLTAGLQKLLREFKEQDLFEIRMSPTSLRKEAAKTGALAGMEFEMIVPNTQSEDEYNQEPDYDADERASSPQDIREFFYDGDHNGRRSVDGLIDSMMQDYSEWQSETFDTRWESDSEQMIYDYIKDNMDDDDVRGMLDLEEEDPVGRQEYLLASDMIDTDRLEPWYEDAQESAREEFFDEDLFEEWLEDSGLTHMSDIESRYSGDVNWPHYRTASSGEGASVQETAESFSAAVGRPARASDSYHAYGQERPAPGKNFYVVEPDGSLEPDDPMDAGLEFVSPPLPIDEIMSDLNKVKKWADLNGCYTNSSTGLHINISVPNYSQDKLDFVKLALLMGDEYVLEQFGRASNTYAKSAMGKIRSEVGKGMNGARAKAVLEKMTSGMEELASKAIHSGITEKYTSINTKDGHVEFRSPGGDWLGDNFGLIENTLLRFTVALSAAMDPKAYREEYLKKLYKVLNVSNEGDPLAIFARYAAGQGLPAQALKSFVRQAQADRKAKKSGEEIVGTPSAGMSTTGPHPEGRGRPNDPNGLLAIVRRDDQRNYGNRVGSEAPDYLFRFTLPDGYSQAQLRAVMQAWAARENVNADDYMVVDTTQFAEPEESNQGNWGIWLGSANQFSRMPGTYSSAQPVPLRRFPSQEAAEQFLTQTRESNPRMRADAEVREIEPTTAQTAAPEAGSVQWNIVADDGETVHTFWNRNVQADANQAAFVWLRTQQLAGRGPFEVVPAAIPGSTQDLQRQRQAASQAPAPVAGVQDIEPDVEQYTSQPAQTQWEVYDRSTDRPVFRMYAADQAEAWRKGQEWVANYARMTPDQPIYGIDYSVRQSTAPVTEAFNHPYQLQWEEGEFGDYDAYTQLPDGSNLSIMFNREGDDSFTVEFWRRNSQEVTGEGDAQRIFATVPNAIQTFLATKEQPRFLSFTGEKGEETQGKDSRVNLYSRMVQRYAASWGYRLKNVHDRGDAVTFDLIKIKQDVTESISILEQRLRRELDALGNQTPTGPETPPEMPAGTIKVDVSDMYDWYKLGQHISNLKGIDKSTLGQGPPHTVFAFGSEELENKYSHELTNLGLKTHDLDEPGEEDVDESQEITKLGKLDSVLEKCIEMIRRGHETNPEKYGRVAACLIDNKNNHTYAINMPGPGGTRRHAERMAIDRHLKSHGRIGPNAIMVTTLSPCVDHMDERYGESCTDLLSDYGIEKCYAGWQDPTQHPAEDYPFNLQVTNNADIFNTCKDIAASFLPQAMAENFADGRNPQDKGDAKRHGINTKASVSSLRKTAKQGGRKGQLAHWLANMKAGRAKAKRK